MAETERRPFDTSLQGLAALYSRHFLAWLRGPNAAWQQELNSVIVAQQRRADFLIRYTLDQEERLLHVEFQTVVQRGELRVALPRRMYTYSAFVLDRYGQMPDQVLVLLQDNAASRRVPNYFAEGGGRLEYQVIRLWEQDPEVVLGSGLVGLMPLVPLMAGQDVESLLTRCTEAIEAGVQSPQERNEVLAVTGLLASLKDTRVVVEFFRRRSLMSLLSETPLFKLLTEELVQERVQELVQERVQELVQERVQELVQELVQERVQIAEEEAARRSKQQSLLSLLEHKFGLLPDDLREALVSVVAPDVLDRLLLVAADVSDLDSFRVRLGSNG